MNMSPNLNSMDLQTVLAELRAGSYRIGVFGEFSTGKSTFLNALMGEDILSVATEPTTATPTRIQWARVFNVLVNGKPTAAESEPPVIASLFPVGSEPVWARLMKDGVLGNLRHETDSIRHFLERWTKEGQDADKTHDVLIQLPQPFLQGRIALVDTPGVNNEFAKHQGITERVLEHVDLALCLVDARQGGKASEMRFIQSVAEKAARTRVVVNKIDLIDEDEREELLEAVNATLQGFWPADRGPCPEPWSASSLASLDPECRSRFPGLAKAFDGLRENLKAEAAARRSNRILARCGNWDQVRYQVAHEASEEGRFVEAHESLLDVLTLYQEAEMEIPEDLLEKIQVCEEAMQGATSRITEAHALVDKVALFLLRNEPNEEVCNLLRHAGEIFLQAQERDPAFEKLARQALGTEANRYLFGGNDPETILDEAEACLAEGTPESEKQRGLALVRSLAEQGYPRAQNTIGICYGVGQALPQDLIQAVNWFRKAAEQGHAEAQDSLGLCYESGQGVSQDLIQAVNWYRKAAEQGHAEAHYHLGNCYFNGQGVSQDMNQAVIWWRKGAEQGHAGAQHNLGYCYFNGQGVSQDLNQAVKWYRKAAEQGQADAQGRLGFCYAEGKGVPQDLDQAVDWYLKAANQGHADAQTILGICYKNGLGVSQDMHQALYWWRKAAEQGHAEAQDSLGLCYANGQGVWQDLNQAVDLFRKAAEQGYAEAQNNLGFCYAEGKGVPQDLMQAVNWFRKAAEQGDAEAQNNLGLCYADGDGVPQDPAIAKHYLRLAADQGHEKARNNLKKLEENESSCFITTASSRVLGWADQGPELTRFRAFRDEVLKCNELGRAEVEIYYDIAPRIVAMVESSPLADAVWMDVAERHLRPILHDLEAGEGEAAHAHYRTMVLELANRYLSADTTHGTLAAAPPPAPARPSL